MNLHLRRAFEPVVARHRRYLLLRATALLWVALGVVALLAWWLVPAEYRLQTALGLGLAAIFGGLHAYLWQQRWQPDYRRLAHSIEQQHPELHSLLVTAVEQAPASGRELNFLQERVVQAAVAESRKQRWLDEVPAWRWGAFALLQLLALPALVLLGFQLGASSRWDWGRPPAARPTAEAEVSVTPGDVELERGTGLIVTARFPGPMPAAAALLIQSRDGTPQRLELARNLNDPVYGGGLPEVQGDCTYRIVYGEQSTRSFKVHVFEHPRLERADATVRPPAYTKLPEKQFPETRRLSGVEGSKLAVEFALNKPVQAAWLQAKNGARVPLEVAAGEAVARLKEFPLQASEAYELHLTDAEGRANKVPESFAVDVLANRRPEIKRRLPGGDQRVSPLQEIAFEANAWDDFGLLAWGLSLTLPGGETREIVFGKETQPDERVKGQYLCQLEPLAVEPDQLLTWHLWADDLGPDGQPRRTAGDIYFAEVRPFEEIFKPGDEGEKEKDGDKQKKGEEATKLAELQKEIIAATWNLQRRENLTAPPTPAYTKDEPVVRESQAGALQQAEEMAKKLEEAKAQAAASEAIEAMKAAVEQLAKAEPAPAELPAAMAPEQKAYAALLKLAAHQFSVTHGKESKGEKGSKSAREQQLDELEFKKDQSRYETKSEATEQKQEQQEQLAMLNRLKELAQRQQDLNERLKEMQTASQEAKTETEREEAKRQLKRLQEEQQQMLADMDELKQSMEQASNQAELAQDRQRLEESRREAQKAAEAMRQEKPTEALAAGSRAEQELQQLRDDFRQRNSGQFRDQMRDLREDARELARKQEEIGQRLAETAGDKEAAHKSLTEEDPREQLGQQFAQQQSGLEKLQQQMREVSEQAETAEPLLSRELYDSLRKNAQAGTDDSLAKARLLSSRGYSSQARPFEEKARKEVAELKEGVERAAESVLGDEGEALRKALGELDKLAEQINREIARARPDLAKNDGARPAADGAPQEGEQRAEKAPARKESGASGTKGQKGDKTPESEELQSGAAAGKVTQAAETAPGEKSEQPGQQSKQGADGKGEAKRPNQNAQPEKGSNGQPQAPGEGKEPAADGEPQTPESEGTGEQSGQGKEGKKGGEGKMAGREPGRSGKGSGPGSASPSSPDSVEEPGGPQNPGEQPGGKMAGAGMGNGPSSPSTEASKPQRGKSPSDLAGRPEPRQRGGILSNAGGGGGTGGGGIDFEEGPLTGESFVKWSDRLRNVEEMLESRPLREQVAQVREAARTERAEFKRHSKEPQWDVVEMKIGRPLAELRDRVTEELARREKKDSLVPIDRDPVPPRYAEQVRKYYEELGK